MRDICMVVRESAADGCYVVARDIVIITGGSKSFALHNCFVKFMASRELFWMDLAKPEMDGSGSFEPSISGSIADANKYDPALNSRKFS